MCASGPGVAAFIDHVITHSIQSPHLPELPSLKYNVIIAAQPPTVQLGYGKSSRERDEGNAERALETSSQTKVHQKVIGLKITEQGTCSKCLTGSPLGCLAFKQASQPFEPSQPTPIPTVTRNGKNRRKIISRINAQKRCNV